MDGSGGSGESGGSGRSVEPGRSAEQPAGSLRDVGGVVDVLDGDLADLADLPADPFLGSYEPRLDDKGRLFLPARFRDRLASGLVLTPGQDHCVYVFTRPDFQRIFAKLQRAPLLNREARLMQRWFLSQAFDQVPDKQGRVTITTQLRAWGRLSKDCVVAGAGSRLEIWDAQAWRNQTEAEAAEFAALSEGGVIDFFS